MEYYKEFKEFINNGIMKDIKKQDNKLRNKELITYTKEIEKLIEACVKKYPNKCDYENEIFRTIEIIIHNLNLVKDNYYNANYLEKSNIFLYCIAHSLDLFLLAEYNKKFIEDYKES